MIDLIKYYKIAKEVNKMASKFLISRFGSVKEMTHKSESHYGIDEDVEANTLYENFLKSKTPEVALYTEEGERNLERDLVWVIDPIEGTSNYRAGNPFWATQIALLYKKEPVIGIVNAPVLKQNFYAIKGGGAFLNKDRISVSPLKELNKAVIDIVRGTKNEDKDWVVKTLNGLIKKVRTNRMFGACSLDISYCAAGITDALIIKGVNLYDLAPGSVIAKEAGAEVLDIAGNNWTISNDSFLTGNKILTGDILKIVNEQ